LCGAGGLDLLELINLHSLSDVGVVDVLCGHIVALLADALLCNDYLVVAVEGTQAELSHDHGVVVGWDADHAEVGDLFLLGRGW